jgi:DNA-binding transcriptional LysR family regulator
MEMQQVRYFLALARTLNFTRAAEDCHVSQPSLTRAIRMLEEELGGELLRRERQQSHLTELGQRMLPLLQQCYDSALSAKSLARSMKTSEVAPLSIAVSCTVNMALLMPPLRELSRAHPGIQLKVKRGTGSEICDLLKEGQVELAVAGRLRDSWERLDQWPVMEEPYELVFHPEHALARRNEVEIGHLSGERFLIQCDCEMREEIGNCLGASGVAYTCTCEVETDHDLVALLETNLGIAIVPKSAAQSENLRRMPIMGLDVRRTIAIFGIAGRRRSPVATTLLNLLRAADWSRYAH